MPSAFDADFALADELLAEAFGIEVQIKRPKGTSWSSDPPVTAEVVIRDNKVSEGGGLQVTAQSREYLIAVADYKVAGVAVEPKSGDRILETINGQACEFELMPFGDRPAFEWADADGRRWLVRTSKVV